MRSVCIALVALLGTSVAATNAWTVRLRQVGPIKLGMSVSDVRRILQDARARLVSPEDVDECAYLESKTLPKGISLMFSHARVVRIDVSEGSYKTVSGVGIGDSEDRVKTVYRNVTVSPHPYIDGHYLEFTPTDPDDRGYGMIFETDGKTVIEFRTGAKNAIGLIEGCS